MPPVIDQKSNVIPLTIPISSELINQALDALTAQGKPIIGATVKVQLGLGNETNLSLQVDESLIEQLNSGQNISLIINR